ncbi:hypothetical protein D9M69_395430 [compost metagenome]
MLDRQLVEIDRKGRATVARLRAEIGGDHRRALQRGLVRAGRQHHRQAQGRQVGGIEEGCRQNGQVAVQRQPLGGQLKARVLVQLGPQRRVQRVFARGRIVAIEAQVQLVVRLQEQRIDRHGQAQLVGMLGEQGDALDQFAVEQHVQRAALGQELVGVTQLQVETRVGNDLLPVQRKRNPDLPLLPLDQQRVAYAEHGQVERLQMGLADGRRQGGTVLQRRRQWRQLRLGTGMVAAHRQGRSEDGDRQGAGRQPAHIGRHSRRRMFQLRFAGGRRQWLGRTAEQQGKRRAQNRPQRTQGNVAGGLPAADPGVGTSHDHPHQLAALGNAQCREAQAHLAGRGLHDLDRKNRAGTAEIDLDFLGQGRQFMVVGDVQQQATHGNVARHPLHRPAILQVQHGRHAHVQPRGLADLAGLQGRRHRGQQDQQAERRPEDVQQEHIRVGPDRLDPEVLDDAEGDTRDQQGRHRQVGAD